MNKTKIASLSAAFIIGATALTGCGQHANVVTLYDNDGKEFKHNGKDVVVGYYHTGMGPFDARISASTKTPVTKDNLVGTEVIINIGQSTVQQMFYLGTAVGRAASGFGGLEYGKNYKPDTTTTNISNKTTGGAGGNSSSNQDMKNEQDSSNNQDMENEQGSWNNNCNNNQCSIKPVQPKAPSKKPQELVA